MLRRMGLRSASRRIWLLSEVLWNILLALVSRRGIGVSGVGSG